MPSKVVFRESEGYRLNERNKLWRGIYARFGIHGSIRTSKQLTYYDPLITFLVEIGKSHVLERDDCSRAYKIAAYLRHIDRCYVETHLYNMAFPESVKDRTTYLNQMISRKISLAEKIGWFLNMQTRLWIVLIMSSITFFLGVVIGVLFGMQVKSGDVSPNSSLMQKITLEEIRVALK